MRCAADTTMPHRTRARGRSFAELARALHAAFVMQSGDPRAAYRSRHPASCRRSTDAVACSAHDRAPQKAAGRARPRTSLGAGSP
jgi:hypothetical protein